MDYRRLTRELIAALRGARTTIDRLHDFHERQAARARRNREWDAEEARRQQEQADWHAHERESAMADLQRARERDDAYGQERALDRLRMYS